MVRPGHAKDSGHGVERALRDSHLGPVGGGMREIMKQILAKQFGL